jgi:hypothetical protein
MYDESASRSDADDNGKFTWAKGDDIAVFSGSAVKKYNLSSGEGTNSATFSPVEQSAFTLASQYAVYPYNAEHALADNTLTVNLPSEYTYSIAEDGSVVTNTNAAMLGTLEDGTFQFRHLAGVLRLMFDALPAGTKALKFETNSRINGKYEVEIAGDEIPELKQDDAAVADGNNIVTINLESALTKAQKNVRFMIPLPTGTYKGFKFSILDADGNILKNDNDLDLVYETTTENEMVRRQLGIYPTLYLNVSIDGVIESEVETAEDLKIALESGKYVRLANDIDLSGLSVSVPAGKKSSVDLNGKKLTIGASTTNSDYIKVYGTLIFKDSSSDKSGKITVSSSTNTKCFYVYYTASGKTLLARGTLTLEDINIESTYGVAYVFSYCYLNIINSTIEVTGSSEFAITAYGNSTTTIKSYDINTGTIDNNKTNITAAFGIIEVAGNSPYIYICGGKLTAATIVYDLYSTYTYSTKLAITNGVLSCSGSIPFLVRNNSQVIITGGEISGNLCQALDNSTVTMNGGSITGTSPSYGALHLTKTSSATIYGNAEISGTFAGVSSTGSGKITIKGNATISSENYYAAYFYGGSTAALEVSEKANLEGNYAIVACGANDIDIKGGTLNGDTYGIYAAASASNTSGKLTIDISDSAIINANDTGIVANDVTNGTISPEVTISGGTITIGGGVTADKNSDCYGVNMSSNKGTFKMTGGSISSAGYGVGLLGYPTATIEGGKIEAEAFALAGNGTYYSDRVDYKISGGELISTNAYAIYLPNKTNTEISGTAKISGWGAVDLQRGTLSISGNAELTADATEAAVIPNDGDGTAGLQFAAVNISARYGDLTLNITGGKFTARNHASIIDNTYNGALTSNSRTVNITGGYFSSDPSSVKIKLLVNGSWVEQESKSFLSTGYKAVGPTDGYYQVVADTAD